MFCPIWFLICYSNFFTLGPCWSIWPIPWIQCITKWHARKCNVEFETDKKWIIHYFCGIKINIFLHQHTTYRVILLKVHRWTRQYQIHFRLANYMAVWVSYMLYILTHSYRHTVKKMNTRIPYTMSLALFSRVSLPHSNTLTRRQASHTHAFTNDICFLPITI
jgi:hypothetical protein